MQFASHTKTLTCMTVDINFNFKLFYRYLVFYNVECLQIASLSQEMVHGIRIDYSERKRKGYEISFIYVICAEYPKRIPEFQTSII